MDLDRMAVKAAVLKVLSARVNDAFREAKDELAALLGAEGRKNAVFDGVKLASVSVTKGGLAVHDVEVFTAWVAEHYPTEIEDVPRVRPAFLDSIKKASERAGIPCTQDGTIDIPGLSMKDPYPLVRPTHEAPRVIDDLWTSGRLSVDGEIKELEA